MVPIAISRSVNEPPLETRDSIGMCAMVSVSQSRGTLYWFNSQVLAFFETWRVGKDFHSLISTATHDTRLTINTTAITITTIDTPSSKNDDIS